MTRMNKDPSDLQIDLLAWMATKSGKIEHAEFKQHKHHQQTVWGCQERGLIYANNTHYEITEDGIRALGAAMRDALRSQNGSVTDRLVGEVQSLKDKVDRISKRIGAGI